MKLFNNLLNPVFKNLKETQPSIPLREASSEVPSKVCSPPNISIITSSNKVLISNTTPNISEKQENFKSSENRGKVENPGRSNQWKTFNQEPVASIKENPVKELGALYCHERLVLNTFMAYANRCHSLFMSQITIAHETGMTPRTVYRIIRKLEKLGLLSTCYRHMQTCLYQLSPYFNRSEIRDKLSFLFPALKYLPIVWLMATSILNSMTNENISDRYYKDIRNKSYLYNVPLKKGKNSDNSGEWSMSNEVFSYIPEYVKKIKEIQGYELTLWGQIKLVSFSKEAVEYAVDKVSFAQELKDPFKFFFKQALEYMRLHKQELSWVRYYELARLMHMPEDPVYVRKKNIEVKRPVVVSKPVTEQENRDTSKKRRGEWVNPRQREVITPAYLQSEIAKMEALCMQEGPVWLQEINRKQLESLRLLYQRTLTAHTLQKGTALSMLDEKQEKL